MAQAKCYAYIYGKQEKKSDMFVQMTYCNMETEEIKRFKEVFSSKELECWFEELIKNYESELPCDIIKVPHHGSKYSSSEAFIEKVSPALAVFQVGRNNYGHPSNEVIDRYREKNCEITRNDINGAIGLIVNEDKSLKVINMSD